jgi:tetratricopeptide (TPR) repeat protein
LAEQAEKYGLKPDEIDQAIRNWLAETSSRGTDLKPGPPSDGNQGFERGLAALYAKNYPEATSYLMSSLEQRKRELEKAQGEVADNAFFLGQALLEQHQYSEAADNYRIALTLRPNDGVILNNLGLALRLGGKADEAESYSRRAVITKGADPRFGPAHPATAISTLNLALLYRDLGKTADADSTFQQAIKITENAYGAESPQLATCLQYYASFLDSAKRYDEAKVFETRARSIGERAAEQSHQKQIEEARSSLDQKTKQLGPQHPEVAAGMIQLADLIKDQGDGGEAERLYKNALTIRTRSGDERLIAEALYDLATLYFGHSRHADAESPCKQAIVIYEKNLPRDYFPLAGALRLYSEILKQSNRQAEAVAVDNRSAALQAKYGRVPSRTAGVNESGASPLNVQQQAPVMNQRAIPNEEPRERLPKP